MKPSKYSIDEDMGLDYQDIPPWRSYQISAIGDTLEQLLDEATISEVDQDGGDICCYGIYEGSTEVTSRALEMIEGLILKSRP